MPTATTTGLTVDELVSQVNDALTDTADELAKANMAIKKVELEVKTALTLTATGEFKLWVLDFAAGASQENVETFTLSFVPRRHVRTHGMGFAPSINEELTTGILAVISSVPNASSALGLEFDEATVAIELTVDASGSVKVAVGGGVKHENAHSVTLTLGSAA